jgi:hypothetical protein
MRSQTDQRGSSLSIAFPSPFIARCVIDVHSEDIVSAPLPHLIASLNKLVRPISIVNLKLFVNQADF